MARRRQQDDIQLSVDDFDGMTVGRLRELLDGISDDTVVMVEEEEWPDYRSGTVDTYYHIVIRRD